MKFLNILTIIFFLSLNLQAQTLDKIDLHNFSQIPILEDGRVKPLDTYARSLLLKFHNKTKLPNQSAIEWLAELIFTPKKSYSLPLFKITNEAVLRALEINKNKDNAYSFLEIYSAISKNQTLLEELAKKNPADLEIEQKQLIELQEKTILYLEISRSMSLISKEIEIPEKEIQAKLHLTEGSMYSYFDLALKIKEFKNIVDTTNVSRLKYIAQYLDLLKDDSFSAQFKIFPLKNIEKGNPEWVSPWSLYSTQNDNLAIGTYMYSWQNIYKSYIANQNSSFDKAITELYPITDKKLTAEVYLNKFELPYKAIALYIFSFILLSFNFIFNNKKLEKFSYYLLNLGFLLHLIYIGTRCYILNRPPVSNLYESTIFVSLVAVFFSSLFELKHRDGLGTFIGSILGSILLFVSFGYQKDGDTMGMLVAVLDTNFWLATHVVTISIGYGCSLVASLLAHFYLIKKANKKSTENFIQLEKNIHGTVLYSLFFSILGTILGGIWADQSWGRFWGWDPKENGALLLCLWLIWIIHGRLNGNLKNLSYSITVLLTSIIVILAWFGVNLLNVGLHSYGFTQDIANNILILCVIEIAFILFILIKVKFINKE